MTHHAETTNQNVDAHDLIGQEGRAEATLGMGNSGLRFSLKLTNPDRSTRTAHLGDMVGETRSPITLIRVQLSGMAEHEAMVLEAHRRSGRGLLRDDTWDVEVTRNGKTEMFEQQIATNIPFGDCHVVAVDVVRRELPGRLAAQVGKSGGMAL